MAERKKAAGKRGGDPALYGKNVERRRDTDDWFYKFRVNGIEYGDTCSTKNKAEAEEIARNLKAEKKVEARKDREAGLGPMQLGRACDVWWNDIGSNNVESGLEFRLKFIREQLGEHKYLRDLTDNDITELQNARARCTRAAGKDDKGNKLRRPLTPAAVKATVVTLRSVINYAGKAKGAAVRMFDWTTWIKKDEEEFDIRIMSEAEQALIWPELTDEVREVAEFNLETPKRINEIIPLSWPNVNVDSNSFRFIRIKLKGKRKLFNDPIGPDEVRRLRRLRDAAHHKVTVFTYVTRRTREYKGGKHVKGQRRPMTYQHFYEQWTAACKKVGITDLNPHCLRHTGATRWYWESGDIYKVSKMLNHANLETTIKYYVKNDPMVVHDFKQRLVEGRGEKVSAKVSARLRAV